MLRQGGRVAAPKGTNAMRYVIVIAAIAFFLAWDGIYNHGLYLDQFVRFLSMMMHKVGLG
ncbi:MAG: hypothetical protein J0H34_12660 [Rhizobiales bacterium]|nr:hypothetical protein [Hyphomicrobiales bacterium]